MRTVSLGPNGFEVSDDLEGLLGSFLTTVVLGRQAGPLDRLFAPDDSLRPPYDENPALDPERIELWAVEREVRFHALKQIVMTGDEVRALLAEVQRLAVEHGRK